MKNLIFYISLAMLCLSSTQLISQTTFTGANSNDWADAGNWDNGLPATGNDATIPNGQLVEISSPLTIQFNIYNSGDILNTAGNIYNYGNIYNSGYFENFANSWENHGTIENLIDAEIFLYGILDNLGTIRNNGTITFVEVAGTGYAFSNGGSLENFGIINIELSTHFLNWTVIYNYSFIYNLGGTFTNYDTVYNCYGNITGFVYGNPAEETTCPLEEICDGLDNDLDGDIDEGCGCTDVLACNFDPSYEIDDGSCNYVCSGCMNPAACNYFPLATTDDGSCILPDGCTDPTACNYDAAKLCDDGSCTFPGCTSSTACNFSPAALCDDGSCIEPDGCTDSLACNYDPAKLCDDGSCIFPGCTNISACNFDTLAGCDDGSCEYLTCRGCTGQMACNYNPSASIDDDSCEYTSCAGCTYPDSPEYNASASIDDGTCTFLSANDCPADLNNDGQVNTGDLNNVLSVYGSTCP